MEILLKNALLVFPEEVRAGSLLVRNGKIAEIFTSTPSSTYSSLDLSGRYLSPGFVELHAHGAGGSDFMDGTVYAMTQAAKTHLEHGTTVLLPTLLAASLDELILALRTFRKVTQQADGIPHLPGVHIEGPYLNPSQKGAMDARYIRNPQPEEYELLMDEGKGIISRWTVAPELPGALAFGDLLSQAGILVSIGHSDANYNQIRKALLHGYTHVTHLYSAMSTITRQNGFRISGVLESALCFNTLTVEMIADGCHLPPELLRFVWQVKGSDKVCLTCDSMRCAGQNVQESILGSLENGQRVIIEDGVAKMPDRRAFAGSIATDDRLVRTMYRQVGLPLYEAVRMMTLTPAATIGLARQKGSLTVGKDADLVCFDENVTVLGVMLQGKGISGVFSSVF